MTRLRNKIAERNIALGTLVSISSPSLIEGISASTMDWILFDMEHSVLEAGEIQTMIQAMQPECLSFIRLPDSSEMSIKKALDTGRDGIIVPQINTEKQARDVMAAALYPPAGRRSVGLGRSAGYGLTLANALKSDNKRISVHFQIENKLAFGALDAIAAIEGADGLFVGPFDLSANLDKAGQINDTEVRDHISKVCVACTKHKLIPGIFSGSVEQAIKEISGGFTFIALSADIIRIVRSCDTDIRTIRDSLSLTPTAP